MNRREYAGSTPYSEQELKVIAEGPDEARHDRLIADGADCALLLDGLIQSLSLPQKRGGIAIVGWSLGNIFILSLLAAIKTLPEESQVRLNSSVKRAILWGKTLLLSHSLYPSTCVDKCS